MGAAVRALTEKRANRESYDADLPTLSLPRCTRNVSGLHSGQGRRQ